MYESILNKRSISFKYIILLITILNFTHITFGSVIPQTIVNKSVINEKKIEAEHLFKIGMFHEALHLYDEIKKHATKVVNHEEEINSLINIGFTYWNLGKIQESSDSFLASYKLSKVHKIAKTLEMSRNALEICNLYLEGKNNRYIGNIKKSVNCFNEAINLSKKQGWSHFATKCYRQMSITYWNQGNFKQFYSLNNKALSIAYELNQKREQCMCLINIGIYFRKINDYSKSLNSYEKALNLSIEQNDKYNISACLNNIGIIYKEIGNFKKSITYLERALQIDRELGNKKNISIDLINLGETLRTAFHTTNDINNLNKALSYFFECLNIAQEIKNLQIEMKALNNIGTVKADLKEFYLASRYFKKALNIASALNDKETMGMALNNLGIVYYHLGDFENSTRCYQEAINLALKIDGSHILWEAYLENANTLQKQKKHKEALFNYKNSISVIEDIRSNIKLENHRASYLGTNKRIEAYYNIIALLVFLYEKTQNNNYKSDAFFYLERAKARAFLDRIELSKIDIFQGVDIKLLNREKELMKEISNLHTKLLTTEQESEMNQNLQVQLKELENELESLKLEIRTQSPAYANLKYPEIINLKQTQILFGKKGVAIFAYLFGKEYSYAFVVKRDNLKIFPIPSKDAISHKVYNYLKCITDKECNNFKLGIELFTSLIAPGLDDEIKSIIIIPDDILNYLPFEALIINNPQKKWLIEKFKVSYSPSISSLREIINRKNRNKNIASKKSLLAIGDPVLNIFEKKENNTFLDTHLSNNNPIINKLKYSSDEIKKINSLFHTSKSLSLTGSNASEEEIKKINLSDFKIIHFATHSIINDKIPDRSAILLSYNENSEEDGLLQMREIYKLKLNSDLVSLSSCQTGLGRLIKGEGIEGLNRAFFYAGSSSVLMSLWSVNDQATFQLMERFYRYLNKSFSIKKSLRNAKLDFIKSDTLAHPFYWAGFIVSGDANRKIFPVVSTNIFMLGLFIVFIIFLCILKNVIKIKTK